MLALEHWPVARAALLHFLVELGDRSFIVIVILASWCPHSGIRRREQLALQLFLVVLGAVVALVLRVATWHSTDGSTSQTGDLVLWAMPLLMGGMALKAYFDFRDADVLGKPMRPAAPISARTQALHSGDWSTGERNSFLQGFKMYEPPTSFAEEQPAKSPTGIVNTGGWESYGSVPLPPSRTNLQWSLATAFVIPLVVVFTVRAADVFSRESYMSWLGVTFGFFTAATLAALTGFVLERQLSDRRFMLVATIAFGSLCLTSTSQALLHFVAPAGAKRGALVEFLALVAAPTTHV